MKKKIFFYCIMSTISLLADNAQTYHRYVWANYNHFAGNVTKADHLYKILFSSQSSIYTHKGYLNLLVDTQQWSHIAKLIPSLQETFAQDPDIQLIFVQALERTKQYPKAAHLVIQLSQTFKTHPDIALRAAQAYLHNKEPQNALLTITSFLNNTPTRPNNFIFYFLQSHIYVQLNQFTQALESVRQCLDLHPHFDKGWLLYASLHEKEGKLKEAVSGYATFLDLSGGNNQIEQHLVKLMLKLEGSLNTQPQLALHKTSIENALNLFEKQQYTQALAHVNRCMEQDPTNEECIILKIQILSAMKKFDSAAETLAQQMMKNQPNPMWSKTLCLLEYNGMSRAEITKALHFVTSQQPDNFWAHAYCADMYLRDAHHDKATEHLEKAALHAHDNKLASKMLYQIALLHYEHNNYDLMHNYLEQAYAKNSQCPHINNALAYYWATKGKNLTKAHDFIEKSLQTDTTNPYFLDTQALILYKEKKYTQAQEVLEKLDNPENSTILLHLAKIHYALNNKENADNFTKKAEVLVKNNQEKKALAKMQLLLTKT